MLALAHRARLPHRGDVVEPAEREGDPLARAAAAARAAGIEAEPVSVEPRQVERLLARCAPALLVVRHGGVRGLVAVLAARRNRLTLLAPGGRHIGARRCEVAAAFLDGRRGEAVERVEQALAAAQIPSRRRRRLAERLSVEGGRRLEGCLVLALPAGAPFLRQLRRAGLGGDLIRFVAAYTAGYALLLGSWWILGRAVLAGRLEPSWLLAWAATLAGTLPFRAVSISARARLTLGGSSLLKRRLLAGALRLEPDEARHGGLGRFLGRVLEAEAVETLTLQGGFLVAVAAVELALSGLVLSRGTAAGSLVGCLVASIAATLALAAWTHRRRLAWTVERIAGTERLIERVLGQRTRVAQEPPGDWHREDDAALPQYLLQSVLFDRARSVLVAGAPRGWLLVGTGVLLPSLVLATGSRTALAIAIGGVLAAYRGFVKLSEGISHLSGAVIGWQQVSRLFAAARGDADAAVPAPPPAVRDGTLLEARDLRFRHRDRGREPLRGASLQVSAGDCLLVEGESGGGKSTLVALLCGLRRPTSGLLLAGGLDVHALGAREWRRRVVAVPQLHENHLLAGSLAFNLLLGRGWPPRPEDLAAAREVCRELGLGDLVERMPAGLAQQVGEAGWQLSHGEASRVFLARALLQEPDVLVLDETLAALDPHSLGLALDAAARRARAVVLVAHP